MKFAEVWGVTKDALKTAWIWFVSHLKMAGIVFVLLLIGLSVINYAIVDFGNIFGIILIAMGLSILDFLPMLGLFVPMAVWAVLAMIFQKNWQLGVSLLVLCCLIMILKQILEPFVVGKSMGISAFEEIGSSVLGFILFGFFGMSGVGLILGPILYTIGKSLYLKYRHRPLVRDVTPKEQSALPPDPPAGP